jgi:hypothetical protein
VLSINSLGPVLLWLADQTPRGGFGSTSHAAVIQAFPFLAVGVRVDVGSVRLLPLVRSASVLMMVRFIPSGPSVAGIADGQGYRGRCNRNRFDCLRDPNVFEFTSGIWAKRHVALASLEPCRRQRDLAPALEHVIAE